MLNSLQQSLQEACVQPEARVGNLKKEIVQEVDVQPPFFYNFFCAWNIPSVAEISLSI